MCRSLAYLHALGICHRDIKPQNLLTDARTHLLKLCDFGSSKALQPGEPSVAYICSRYYRAPELIFGAQDYTNAIDVWSMGCVFAELMLCKPIFPGETGIDQLVEIIKILGTPTREQVLAMNKSYTEFNFPPVQPQSWQKVRGRARGRMPPPRAACAALTPPEPPARPPPAQLFKSRASDAAIDLCSAMLTYEPLKRITAAAALLHPFFDELRLPVTRLPDGGPLPPLFNFVDEERKLFTPEQLDKLIPEFARASATAEAAGAGAGAGSSANSSARASSALQTARSDATMTSPSPGSAAAAAADASMAPPTPAAPAAGGPASARLHPNTAVSASTSARTGAGASSADVPPTAR